MLRDISVACVHANAEQRDVCRWSPTGVQYLRRSTAGASWIFAIAGGSGCGGIRSPPGGPPPLRVGGVMAGYRAPQNSRTAPPPQTDPTDFSFLLKPWALCQGPGAVS